MTTCRTCQLQLDDSCYYLAARGKLDTQCKKCKVKYNAARRKSFGESYYKDEWAKVGQKYSERKKALRISNPEFAEKERQKSRMFRVTHPDYSKNYLKKWQKEHRVQTNLRRRFKRRMAESSPSLAELVGASLMVFKAHISSQFREGMNWDNYGQVWTIDHILPLSFAQEDYDDTLALFHYSNSRPLFIAENSAKNGRLIPALLENLLISPNISPKLANLVRRALSSGI